MFAANGRLFQPGGRAHAWPRNRGYGAYGENVGIGNIDDDPELEIITTFDNHQIHAFNLDGTSVLASPWFTNRESGAEGKRMAWGDFIRWASPKVERRHYPAITDIKAIGNILRAARAADPCKGIARAHMLLAFTHCVYRRL